MRKIFRVFILTVVVAAICFYAVNNYRLIIQIFNEEETTKRYLKTVVESEGVIKLYRDSLIIADDTITFMHSTNDSLKQVNSDQGIKIKHLSHEVNVLSDSLHRVNKHYAKGVLQPVE